MSTINTVPFNHPAIMKIYAERNEFNLEPEYQRNGNIWSLEKQQLLIDSIINNYDIPKIYFHELINNKNSYSVIDGRQRLQTIWDFMDGKFSLSDDFKYFKDTNLNLKSLSYNDLANKYPNIRINFDSFGLPIIIVQTDDINLIEDMFSRLNEAVPLNAPEKRNAIGGFAVQAIRRISNNCFLTDKIKINNSRYQHYEISAKILYLEDCIINQKKIIDTSKSFLDKFVINNKNKNQQIIKSHEVEVIKILDALNTIFSDSDPLLKRQGDIPIYYLLIKDAFNQNLLSNIDRQRIVDFQDKVNNVGKQSFEHIEEKDYIFYEYYNSTQQGTNNSSNIRARIQILESFFNINYEKSLIRFHG